MSRRSFATGALALLSLACRGRAHAGGPSGPEPKVAVDGLERDPATVTPLTHTDAEWKKLLEADAYDVLREEGTERAFTGRYWDNHEPGTYVCRGCGLAVFGAEHKFESGTGWPSFTQPVAKGRIAEHIDVSWGMARTEVHCERCGGHMGHVFDDGPPPTGKRYCINSVSLVFVKKA